MPLRLEHRAIKAAPSGEILGGAGVDLLNIEIDVRGIQELIKTLNKSLPRIITMRQANILIYIGIDLLANALPRTPWATGQLRESGEAIVRIGRRHFRVAKGKADGTVEVETRGITRDSLGKARTMDLDVSFSRYEDGLDIAQWTHEIIYAYEDRPSRPAATKQFTGPKYLEIPFNERIDDYYDALADLSMIERDILAATRIKSLKRGRYDVDMIELIEEQIEEQISFGGQRKV